jgi:hypothetical protein
VPVTILAAQHGLEAALGPVWGRVLNKGPAQTGKRPAFTGSRLLRPRPVISGAFRVQLLLPFTPASTGEIGCA